MYCLLFYELSQLMKYFTRIRNVVWFTKTWIDYGYLYSLFDAKTEIKKW